MSQVTFRGIHRSAIYLICASVASIWGDIALANTSVTWLGGAGAWSTKANWSGTAVPNNNASSGIVYDVLIDGKSNIASSVSIGATETVNSLTLDSGDGVIINSKGVLSTTSLTDNGVITVNAGGTLTTNTLSFSTPSVGQIDNNGGYVNINGSFSADSGGTILLENGGTVSIGTLVIATTPLAVAATCTLRATQLNSSGSISVAGTLQANGLTNTGIIQGSGTGSISLFSNGPTCVVTNTGGTISLSGSATALFSGALVSGGTLVSTGSSSFNCVSSTLSNLTNLGTIVFNSYSNSLAGDINNQGQLNFVAGYITIPTGTLTLSGGGTVEMSGAYVESSPTQALHTLVNHDNTIEGYGTLFYGIGGGIAESLINDATIRATSPGALVIVGDTVSNRSDGTMQVNANSALSVQSPQFSSTGVINVDSGGTFQISGGANASGTYVSNIASISNHGTIRATQDLSTISSITGGTLSSSYTAVVTLGGFSSMSDIIVSFPSKIVLMSSASPAVSSKMLPNNSTHALDIDPSGFTSFDVTNNAFLINYGAGTDPRASVVQALSSGSANGSWNSNKGITSSTAAAGSGTQRYGVGYADAADGIDPLLSTGQLEVAYTLYGDMTLRGTVDRNDLRIFSQYYGQSVTGGWAQGDFLGTGTVTSQDFALLAKNYGQNADGSTAALSLSDLQALQDFANANGLQSFVPEPGGIGIAIGVSYIFRRRRRPQNK